MVNTDFSCGLLVALFNYVLWKFFVRYAVVVEADLLILALPKRKINKVASKLWCMVVYLLTTYIIVYVDNLTLLKVLIKTFIRCSVWHWGFTVVRFNFLLYVFCHVSCSAFVFYFNHLFAFSYCRTFWLWLFVLQQFKLSAIFSFFCHFYYFQKWSCLQHP